MKETNATISEEEVKQKMQAQEEMVLLDVRTEEEYKEGHIPSSELLPLQEIEEKAEKKLPKKEETIIVYCRSGVRSKKAVQMLQRKGYQNVYDLGGILDWTGEIEQ